MREVYSQTYNQGRNTKDIQWNIIEIEIYKYCLPSNGERTRYEVQTALGYVQRKLLKYE